MNEDLIGFHIRRHLDHGVASLPAPTVSGLRAARQAALDHHHAHASHLHRGAPGALSASWSGWARSVAAALAVVVSVVAWTHWSDMQRAGELEELDSALLSDDLPINAYLDRGFDAWLRRAGDS